MKTRYHYDVGTKRWRKHDNSGDVRGYKTSKGWEAFAHFVDNHPTTGRALKSGEWWFEETYVGDDA